MDRGGFGPPKSGDDRFTVCSLWPLGNLSVLWSWRLESNPQPADYKSAALPVELHQRKNQKKWCLRAESNHRQRDFQSLALPTELPRQNPLSGNKKWRPGWGSNPRPLAWQASVLTSWTTRPYIFFDFLTFGGPSRTRTLDQPVMSRPLWPTELKARTSLRGRGEETRTPDPMVPNHVRYQLRYTPSIQFQRSYIIPYEHTVCQAFFR